MGKKFDFSFESLTYDEIKAMTIDEIHLNIMKFKRMIKEARKTGKETRKFEVEFCYLDNERQLREKSDFRFRR